MVDSIIQRFVTEQRELLSLELQADSDEQEHLERSNNENDERTSHILGNLEATDISVGLYGRTVVQLISWSEKNSGNSAILAAHRFTVGDEVEIRSKHTSKNGYPNGVVSAITDTTISIALFQIPLRGKSLQVTSPREEDEDEAIGKPPLSLVPRSSVEVHRKLMYGLEILEKNGINHPIAGSVVQAMFRPLRSIPDTQCSNPEIESFETFNAGLDDSQKSAIAFALQPDRPVALIHGPPGTGKTTTVAELVQQAVHLHGMKVLVTAPSNVAVDNILERLVQPSSCKDEILTRARGSRKGPRQRSLRPVRLGHPARIKQSILPYSLEALVQGSEGTDIVKDVRRELQDFLRVISNPRSRPQDKKIAYREIKALRKEVRTREEKVVEELINSAQVVLATTVGASNRILDKIQNGFDLVVIDEAAQALEASCWIPALRGKKLVLAGDHCQLPPTIKSKHRRAREGLGRTMFERLMQLYGDENSEKESSPTISRMLQRQYRMHETIANWASKAMYHGELKTHDSVKHRTLADLEGVSPIEDDDEFDISESAMLLIDTAGCDMHESVNSTGSRSNEGEANLVGQQIERLSKMGLKQDQMCIITPYNGQVELLRTQLLPKYPQLEIRSVDGFQGGERDAVVLSLVRSSERGGKAGIGFLRDDRRQNVAVTRAKRHLTVICDSETVSQSKFISSLVTWIEEHGDQRSAAEYLPETCGKPDEADLWSAEVEILKLLESPSNVSFQRTPSKSVQQKTPVLRQRSRIQEEQRKAIMEKVSVFSEESKAGEEMILSSELSSYDRRLVHEFAAQLGLEHQSEGVEGEDRRIILRKEKSMKTIAANQWTRSNSFSSKEPQPSIDDEAVSSPMPATAFGMLIGEDSDDDSSVDENEKSTLRTEPKDPPSSSSNSLLADLRRDREERQKGQSMLQPPAKTLKRMAKGNKGNGRKLGGTKKGQPKEDNFDELDDMAFLDAQIEKVQNAHGRKVVGKGKGYRTIVNGILNSRPDPPKQSSNTKAAASLQSKLKDAKNARKSKGTKKKRK